MSVIDDEWLRAQADALKVAITAYRAAILALTTGAQQYTINTGQTVQTVTKANLAQMRITLQSLENDLATYDARLCGGGSYGQPGF